ncbi:MAG TPA: DUF4012 domain-containing protein [Mycobacteriales bacterium]|nr:DUF4012 domain-containing protein [Mycobacteriales bacterium]
MTSRDDRRLRREAEKYLRETEELREKEGFGRTGRRRRRRRPSTRQQLGRGMVLTLELSTIVVVAGIAAGLWMLVHALDATGRLADARTDIQRVRADLLAGRSAVADMRAAQRDARAARHDTHDFVWATAAWLPPVKTVRGITTAIDTLATQALPDFVSVAPSLRPAVLRVSHNQIALAPLVAAAPTMQRAAAAASLARSEVADLPGGWIGLISNARQKVLSQLTSLAGTVDDLSRFTTAGPAMLGLHGERRYFVGIQNNAEARATGGLVAAYAVVTANHGKIHVVEHGTDTTLQRFQPAAPVVALSKAYDAEYGNYHPAQSWPTTNLSPNFPDAGNIWTHMWEAQSGEHVDGAFGVDPVGLAELLGSVGTVTLPNYPQVFSGANLATFIESTEYSAFPGLNNPLRKSFLSEVGTAVIHKLLSGAGNPQQITAALGRVAGEGHLKLWSRRAPEQSHITGTPLAGELSPTTAPYASLTVDNDYASKLDYYLDRRLSYQAGSCGSSRRESTISVTLTNNAPLHGLPDYVRTKANGTDQPPVVQRIPNNKLLVFIHATSGATLERVTLDGQVVPVGANVERGHPVFMVPVLLRPGVPRTIVVSLSEPTAGGAATTQVQPLARPQVTDFDVPRCG